ncbi:dihydroorotate dehydrogenase electron transfer subunit [Erysipelothrix sp. HDW6B]|uniref:dihydroorotate dehydrogenase electron transfer subunit n=1 Tax=Erysipelothrix TaxID=1647 RepID=UPI001359C8B4|nr:MULTISPECIES: dihydroorotate dehydrogenase electron transfer subunit [Erysipelothrix]QIK86882.1 dihydroorotate dehydrogenase electron transfer subunit [Erysipelothrix sp. HDW6B]
MAIIKDIRIVQNQEIAHNIYEMILESKELAETSKAGQFLHLKLHDQAKTLRRPISIASIDKEHHRIVILYRVVGQGTLEMSTYTHGDSINVMGPLGNGFDTSSIKKDSKVLIIGGGIGVAPLYELAKQVSTMTNNVTMCFGFTTHSDIYYEDVFKQFGHVIYTTNDGTYGQQGYALDALNNKESFDMIYACGPHAMNVAIQNRFKHHQNLFLSLEERMACGMGACYGCETKDKKHRVCKDGPVFNAKEIQL